MDGKIVLKNSTVKDIKSSSFLVTLYERLNRPGYKRGIFWMLLACCISNSNDIIVKFVGPHLPTPEVAFLRFLFSFLWLVPFAIARKETLKTAYPRFQILRAVLLLGGITLWCKGVCRVPLTVVTTMSFTTPLFVLPMAAIFLKEKVAWQRWFATVLGFVGIVVVANPSGPIFESEVFSLAAATIMFASLDVINKKIVVQETMLSMLFYSALGTMLLSVPFAFWHWIWPNLEEIGLLIILGAGANLILFCLLKAFSMSDVSALVPFRYVELLISSTFGYLLFNELPSSSMITGAFIIIPSTLYLAYRENRTNS
jgi:S-adenosylmethionine uptake transporter